MAKLLDCTDPAARPAHLETLTRSLKSGRIAVIPGESSYLLVGDAFSSIAVERLRDAKGRASTPLSVLVGEIATADGVAAGIPPYARDLLRAFWPGMLTVVMRQQPSLAWPLTAKKIALRMPLHPIAIAAAAAVGPLAFSTANRAGSPVARDAGEADLQLGDDVALILDAGPSPDFGRSTVVDVSGFEPELVRAGAVDTDRVREVCPALVVPSVA